MIEARQLVKWYGPTLAVNDVSFSIAPGSIVGFLGPNGAGKSTTLRILTGYLPPTSGTAVVAGYDVLTDAETARASIGYLPESTPLYHEMRVDEYLHFRGSLMKMDRATRKARIADVCDRCGLSHNRRRIIGRLSRGNRQRVGIAQALLHEPPVLILDEPTAGLDPNQIREIRKLLTELKGKHTILLSTHILPEVEMTADRVIIIANGGIVADGTPAELRRNVGSASGGSDLIVEARADAAKLEQVLKLLPQVKAVRVEPGTDGRQRATVTAAGASDGELRDAIGAALLRERIAITELRREAASLEEFFVQITAKQHQRAEDAA